MPLFNLFSPDLVDFTSESESGERRDVYKGISESSMIGVCINFLLERCDSFSTLLSVLALHLFSEDAQTL